MRLDLQEDVRNGFAEMVPYDVPIALTYLGPTTSTCEHRRHPIASVHVRHHVVMPRGCIEVTWYCTHAIRSITFVRDLE